MKVDVMMNTYNSERKLKQCLESIHASIPINKLIIVDKFSTDKTVEIAKEYGAEIIQSNCSLAEARAMGFQKASTPLVVNIDSDIILPKDWFNQMMRYWRSNQIGALWGVPIHLGDPTHTKYQLAMYKFRGPTHYHIPFLSNMIARRDILENIEFPLCYKLGSVAGEDWFLMHWIEQQGFKCVIAPVYCEHYSYPPLINCKTYWGGASTRLSGQGMKGLLSILLRFFFGIPQGIFTALVSHDSKLLTYRLRHKWQEIYGFLHWHKYFNLRR